MTLRELARQIAVLRRSPPRARLQRRRLSTKLSAEFQSCNAAEILEKRLALSSFFVAPNGDDGNAGTLASPFATIARGMESAQPGDSVLLRAGTYRETISAVRSGTTAQPITVKSFNDEEVFVSAADVVEGPWTETNPGSGVYSMAVSGGLPTSFWTTSHPTANGSRITEVGGRLAATVSNESAFQSRNTRSQSSSDAWNFFAQPVTWKVRGLSIENVGTPDLPLNATNGYFTIMTGTNGGFGSEDSVNVRYKGNGQLTLLLKKDTPGNWGSNAGSVTDPSITGFDLTLAPGTPGNVDYTLTAVPSGQVVASGEWTMTQADWSDGGNGSQSYVQIFAQEGENSAVNPDQKFSFNVDSYEISTDGQTILRDDFDNSNLARVSGNNPLVTSTITSGYDQIFVNGEMQVEARDSNKVSADLLEADAVNVTMNDAYGLTSSAFDGKPDDYYAGARFHGRVGQGWAWQTSVVNSSSGSFLQLDEASASTWWWPNQRNSASDSGIGYVYGKLNFLDADREWHIQHNSASDDTLYLRTIGGANPAGQLVERKVREWTVNVNGHDNIIFKGLNLRGGAVLLDGTGNVLEDSNARYLSHYQTFDRAGQVDGGFAAGGGVVVRGDGNVVRGNTIYDTAGSGVVASGSDHLITRNHIHHVNYSGTYGTGVSLSGRGHTLTFNTIHDTGRDNLRPTGAGLTVMYNDLSRPGRLAHDAGMIYTFGQDGLDAVTGKKTRIAYNWVHELGDPTDPLGEGIYLDNFTQNFVVDHNVIWDLGLTQSSQQGIKLNAPMAGIEVYHNTLIGAPTYNTGTWTPFPDNNPDNSFWTTANHGMDYVGQNNLVIPSNANFTNEFEDFASRDFRPAAGSTAIDPATTIGLTDWMTTNGSTNVPSNFRLNMRDRDQPFFYKELTGEGVTISGINDGFVGTTPDNGAYEIGMPRWTAGVDGTDDILGHRKSQLTVIVQDQNGNPLPDATVDVSMTQHKFTFGTQVRHRLFGITQSEFDGLNDSQKRGLLESGSGSGLIPTWADVLNYRQAVHDNFNHIVPTNGMQWVAYNNAGPTHVDTAVTIAQNAGFGVTGHSVVWGKDGWPTPDEYRSAANPDSQVFHDALIADRLSGTGVMARYSEAGAGPPITDWDVLNEPLHETYYAQTFTNAGIYASHNHAFADVFIRAEALRPDAGLAVNDYNIINSAGDGAAQQYRDLVNSLLALGAPIDVIKVQAHIARADISKADIIRRLDILAETGLPIVISEFDMRDDAGQLNAAQQQQTFRDFLEASFEHPAVDGFLMWGFWDPGHWRGNGPLYNTDWSFKAEAAPWADLVQGAWKSEELGQTVDANGRWTNGVDLFNGIYEVTAVNGLTSATVTDVELTDSREIVITLPNPELQLTIAAASVSENDGDRATTATVSRTSATTNELVVMLSGSDDGEATVQATVTIPAGQITSAPFNINAVNDGVVDATQTVVFTASATGHVGSTASLDVVESLAHRMSELTVKVQDQFGNPLPDATIDVTMTEHAFKFGTQVRDRMFAISQSEFDGLNETQKKSLLPNLESQFGIPRHTPTWQDILNYRNFTFENFNHVVPTTGMQWIAINNNGSSIPDAAFTMAHANGLTTTAASVVWQKDAWPTPSEFRPAANPNAQVFHDALVADRLSSSGVLNQFSETGSSPKITDWKLLNEPLHEHYHADTFVAAGIYPNEVAALTDYFVRADVVRPDATLSINEYALLNSANDDFTIQYRDLINSLLAAGAPIDRIGVQAHIARNDITKADIVRRLDILAETGLPIEISEFDARDDAGQLNATQQEELFRDILEASFEHPSVDGFIMWGIWDAAHWRGNAPLYDKDWNIKSEASPWFDLVRGEWMASLTDVQVDAQGEWQASAGLFNGTYNLAADYAGDLATLDDFELNADGTVTLTINVAPDLRSTSFNANPDHIVTGETEVIFTVQNTGSAAAGSFETQIIWSSNETLGDADDVIITAATETFTGLDVGASATRTVNVSIDKASLFRDALAKNPAGSPVGMVSTETSRLFLKVDSATTVAESDEANNSSQGHLVDWDDITYFPWDKNRNGVVEPLEALTSIQAIGTSDAASDFNGDEIVTPLEALSAVQRIGYLRADVLKLGKATTAASAAMSSTTASALPGKDNRILRPSEAVAHAALPTIANVTVAAFANVADVRERELFATESDEIPVSVLPPTDESPETGREPFTSIDWLDVI